MKYVDIKYLLYYLSSPPHTIRMTCALSCESILCKRGTLPSCTAWTLRVWNRPGGPVSCTSTCCSCANLQHQNHMNSTCFSSPSTLFYSNTMSMAVVVHAVYLPGRMGLADFHRHMAWGPEVHPDRVRVVSVHLNCDLIHVRLLWLVLQTAALCWYTPCWYLGSAMGW